MNNIDIQSRLAQLGEQKRQILAKQEEGKNVIISGQKIIDETNSMLLMINGAEQDCQFWLQEIATQEAIALAAKEAADKVAASGLVQVAAFEEADAYKVDESDEQDSVATES